MRVFSQDLNGGCMRRGWLRGWRGWSGGYWLSGELGGKRCEGMVMGMCCCSVCSVVTGKGGGRVNDILQAVVLKGAAKGLVKREMLKYITFRVSCWSIMWCGC